MRGRLDEPVATLPHMLIRISHPGEAKALRVSSALSIWRLVWRCSTFGVVGRENAVWPSVLGGASRKRQKRTRPLPPWISV